MDIDNSRILISPLELPYTGPICVIGAFGVNGTYTFDGYKTWNGRTSPSYIYYISQFQPIVIDNFTINGNYRINEAFGDNNDLYYGVTSPAPAYPFLETAWVNSNTFTPASITVTRGQCVVYSFTVSPNIDSCDVPLNSVTIYSSSPVLGIGSTLFTNSNLTTPTTYSLISNPNNPNNRYFTITGNTILDNILCG